MRKRKRRSGISESVAYLLIGITVTAALVSWGISIIPKISWQTKHILYTIAGAVIVLFLLLTWIVGRLRWRVPREIRRGAAGNKRVLREAARLRAEGRDEDFIKEYMGLGTAREFGRIGFDIDIRWWLYQHFGQLSTRARRQLKALRDEYTDQPREGMRVEYGSNTILNNCCHIL